MQTGYRIYWVLLISTYLFCQIWLVYTGIELKNIMAYQFDLCARQIKIDDLMYPEKYLLDKSSIQVNSIDKELLLRKPYRIGLEIGELKLLSLLVYAEAGNQDQNGMRYVADVVLNRVDDERFPDTVYDVIYQRGQFQVIQNGRLEWARNQDTRLAFQAVIKEYYAIERLNDGILYFNFGTRLANGSNGFKHMDHWFGY